MEHVVHGGKLGRTPSCRKGNGGRTAVLEMKVDRDHCSRREGRGSDGDTGESQLSAITQEASHHFTNASCMAYFLIPQVNWNILARRSISTPSRSGHEILVSQRTSDGSWQLWSITENSRSADDTIRRQLYYLQHGKKQTAYLDREISWRQLVLAVRQWRRDVKESFRFEHHDHA